MKVLFNCLPPSNIDHPSPALSILQSFLNHNGYDARTIYWNILTFHVMSYYPQNDDVLRNLIPFLSIITKEYNDKNAEEKLCSYLQALQPRYGKSENFYKNSIEELSVTTEQKIYSELSRNENSADVYGISAKFYQWIPGVVLAKAIKRIHPQSRIVIGGFGSRDAATAMIKRFHDFDYAIWGEGEYPLLELCDQIKNDSLNLNEIPRLIYRENKSVKASEQTKSKYLDFNNYIFPDVSDYFTSAEENKIPKEIATIMLNTVNGCRWNRCAFCSYAENKLFRERTAENIFNEIRCRHEKYGVKNFYFADNDLVGRDAIRLEKLLDLLTEYRKSNDFEIYGEMIPSSKITPALFSKMNSAGFSKLYIGYEAVTDGLLKKMKKENNFPENILFVKNSLRSSIRPQLHIIQGIPGETEDDIKESIRNLHYLRFFFSDKETEVYHKYITLNLYKGTEYFRDMPAEEKKNFTENPVAEHLPGQFIRLKDRFDFFNFRRKELKNKNLWQEFAATEMYYRKNKFTYGIKRNKSSFTYKEFLNGKEIKSIIPDHPAFYDILFASNETIVTLDKLHAKLTEEYRSLTKQKIKEYLDELRQHGLLYHNEKYSAIVSVIDVNKDE